MTPTNMIKISEIAANAIMENDAQCLAQTSVFSVGDYEPWLDLYAVALPHTAGILSEETDSFAMVAINRADNFAKIHFFADRKSAVESFNAHVAQQHNDKNSIEL